MTARRPAASARARGFAVGICAAAILSTTSILIRHLGLAYHLPVLILLGVAALRGDS